LASSKGGDFGDFGATVDWVVAGGRSRAITRLLSAAEGELDLKVTVTGATGFIGQALVPRLLARGDTVVAVSRNPTNAHAKLAGDITVIPWSPVSSGPSLVERLSESDAIVNLAGEPLADKRWTAEEKDRILRSRVDAGNAIVGALRAASPRPKVLVNASAIGYYGPRGAERLVESSPPGHDFLADVVKQWESSVAPAAEIGVRLVLLRTGFPVLGSSGGALPRFAMPFKFFGGGVLGRRDQWVSWIHIDDEVELILFALDSEVVSGPVNATAPNPVTMADFSAGIGRALNRPVWVPAVPTVLRLIMGERVEPLFSSQRVFPDRALGLGFQFKYVNANQALESLLAG
jgi:hypothetical protein